MSDWKKALKFESPEYIFVRIDIVPAAWIKYREKLEEIMIDFAEEPLEFQLLIDKVHEYNMRQARKMISGFPEGENIEEAWPVLLADDLGTQKALPISPAKWRKYLKPFAIHWKNIAGIINKRMKTIQVVI